MSFRACVARILSTVVRQVSTKTRHIAITSSESNGTAETCSGELCVVYASERRTQTNLPHIKNKCMTDSASARQRDFLFSVSFADDAKWRQRATDAGAWGGGSEFITSHSYGRSTSEHVHTAYACTIEWTNERTSNERMRRANRLRWIETAVKYWYKIIRVNAKNVTRILFFVALPLALSLAVRTHH